MTTPPRALAGPPRKAERLILGHLVSVWPESTAQDELAVATGYAFMGGGFNNAMGRIRGFELITGDRAELRAADMLDPG